MGVKIKSERKKVMLRSNKGFTLVEILVALTIVLMVVFAFTPLMTYSLRLIYESGAGQEKLYESKSRIEEKLSERNKNEGLPSVSINTVFKATTSPSGEIIPKTGPISVTGTFVSDTGKVSDFELATVYTAISAGDNKARIRLVPNSVSEDDKLLGRVIYIYSEFLAFTEEDAERFSLFDASGNKVNNVSFSFLDNMTIAMTLSSSTPSVTATLQPYTVKLGTNDSYTAKLYVEPPNIIVASENGEYYSSKGIEGASASSQAVFARSSAKIAGSVNEIIWDSSMSRYIAVGNGGAYRTLSGGNAWSNGDITGNGSILLNDYLILGERNKTPDIELVGIDYNGMPIIGGRFMYQVKSIVNWSLQWVDDQMHGFVTDYNQNGSNLQSRFTTLTHSGQIDSVNDIITVKSKGTFYSVAVGGDNADKAFVYVRCPSVDNGKWFNAMSSSGLPSATAAGYGASYNGEDEIPVFLLGTSNGKIYSARAIVKGNTNWKEESIGNGGPGKITAISFGGDRFVAVGSSGNALVGILSPSGSISWNAYNISSGASFNDIEYINDRFYAVGQNKGKGIIYSSTDGVTWVSAIYSGGDPAQPFKTIAGRNQP